MQPGGDHNILVSASVTLPILALQFHRTLSAGNGIMNFFVPGIALHGAFEAGARPGG